MHEPMETRPPSLSLDRGLQAPVARLLAPKGAESKKRWWIASPHSKLGKDCKARSWG